MEWSLIQKKVHRKVGYVDIRIIRLMPSSVLCRVKCYNPCNLKK